MPLIGELINNLAQKAGIAADSPELKSLLASPELATINVPDELSTLIDKNLLSLEAAKNNHPDIRNKYAADFYDGIDKQLMTLIATDTFDQADLDEIKAEKSTTKKQEIIISKLKAAKSKAKGADKEEINQQLAAAHEAARLAKEEVNTVRTQYEGQIKDIRKKTALSAVLSGYKTIYDELPGTVKLTGMEALINTALQDKKADLLVDENGNLQLVSKDGTNVFGSNNVQLTPQSFFDQTFAPILKVSDNKKSDANQQQRQTTTVDTSTKGDASISPIRNHNAQVIADLARPSNALI